MKDGRIRTEKGWKFECVKIKKSHQLLLRKSQKKKKLKKDKCPFSGDKKELCFLKRDFTFCGEFVIKIRIIEEHERRGQKKSFTHCG